MSDLNMHNITDIVVEPIDDEYGWRTIHLINADGDDFDISIFPPKRDAPSKLHTHKDGLDKARAIVHRNTLAFRKRIIARGF